MYWLRQTFSTECRHWPLKGTNQRCQLKTFQWAAGRLKEILIRMRYQNEHNYGKLVIQQICRMNLAWTLKESKEVEKFERMKYENKQNGKYIAGRECT